MNSAAPWIQVALAILTLIVIGLIGPLIRRLVAVRSEELHMLHASLDRIENKIDRHIEWHSTWVRAKGD